MDLVLLAEILRVVSSVILIISAGLFLSHLERTRKRRKLSTFESTMYIVLQIAFILLAISVVISFFVG